MSKKKKNRGSRGIDPWDNLRISWDTHPDNASLGTDASVNWPFGDGEWMTGLNDEYFKVFLKKAWALCKAKSHEIPAEKRDAWLQKQKKRLDGYRAERKAKDNAKKKKKRR